MMIQKSAKLAEILKNYAKVRKIPQIPLDNHVDLDEISKECAHSRYRRSTYSKERASENPPKVPQNILFESRQADVEVTLRAVVRLAERMAARAALRRIAGVRRLRVLCPHERVLVQIDRADLETVCSLPRNTLSPLLRVLRPPCK